MKTIAIIPSGGIGSRFNSPIPKQYVKVLGKELICYTLEVFQKCELLDEIIISASKNYFPLLNDIIKIHDFSKVTKIVEGGKERQDSVLNGLRSKKFADSDIIVVHDAARPLISESLLKNTLLKSKNTDSVIVAIKARDTLVEFDKLNIKHIDRSKKYYVQTPQVFRYGILKKSFDLAQKNNFYGTDESMLVRNAGFSIDIIEGEFQNFKITTNSDLETFRKLIE